MKNKDLKQKLKALELEIQKLEPERQKYFDVDGRFLGEAIIGAQSIDPLANNIMQKLFHAGLADLNTKKELTLFLKNYSKEKYEVDIQPLISKAIKEL